MCAAAVAIDRFSAFGATAQPANSSVKNATTVRLTAPPLSILFFMNPFICLKLSGLGNKTDIIRRVKYWEIIADRLSAAWWKRRRIQRLARATYWPPYNPRGRTTRQEMLANTNDNIHIDAHRLIGDNRERSRRRPNMLGHAILNIQNIIARRQRDSIVSILIGCHPRNFFLLLLTQNNQGILNVGFGRTLCLWHLIRFSHRHTENNFQMPFQETLLCGSDQSAGGKQKCCRDASEIGERLRHNRKKK